MLIISELYLLPEQALRLIWKTYQVIDLPRRSASDGAIVAISLHFMIMVLRQKLSTYSAIPTRSTPTLETIE